jgi:hypothetical protein
VRTIRQVVPLQRAFKADVMAAGSMRLRATSTTACGNCGAIPAFPQLRDDCRVFCVA